MIVGTAGHIDHGKTTLVRALTGVDTDRLPEEKKRGISIELGYAFLDVPGAGEARIGFIDVPGHERLVHTMLAGATGIDFALLLVAADDGVMPQTREHLAVLSLLGLARGVVAITKVDRADAQRRAQVRAEVAALLQESSLAAAPVIELSAQSGEGVDALRQLLFDAARAMPVRAGDQGAAFRLAIDRAFTLDGVGTVVTGTVHAGRVAVGDDVALAPNPMALRARVRSVHAQNRSVAHAQAGQRCAVALAGVSKGVSRGQWLVAEDHAVATERLDAVLTLWHAEGKPLKSGTPVHVHVGSMDVMGTVAVLGVPGSEPGSAVQPVLAPGQRALVQLVLRHRIGAWHGDRVVLRDNAAARTLAGGQVLDPFAPARYRRTPQRLAELRAWSLPDAASRLSALIDVSPFGVSLQRVALAEGRPAGATLSLPPGALHAADATQGGWVLGESHLQAAKDAALAVLAGFHAREPQALGPDAARLRRLAAPRLPDLLWQALLSHLRAEGLVVLRGSFVHLPEHGLRLSATDERLAQKLRPWMSTAGYEGSWVRDLAGETRESEALMRTTLARLAQRGEVHQVTKDLYYPQECVLRMAAILRGLAAETDGGITAARFRDATGLGRKRAIQLLEYFDRVGLLRRLGDVHRLRGDTALFAQSAS